MAEYESYHAVADEKIARSLADTASPFQIEVRFLGGLTAPQKKAFKDAADRWTRVIVGDLATVVVDGEEVDDILILADGSDIDGPGGILGQAGPTHLRPASAGSSGLLPAKGKMSFDKADLKKMQQDRTLNDVITHEMGHVLGIGTVWSMKGLLKGAATNNPTFTGKQAMKEYRALQVPPAGNKGVPVENIGGPGTRNSHWRETVFRNELMSGFIGGTGNPLSRMTAGSLQDIGYVVDLDAAEAYTLPNLMMLAEEGVLGGHVGDVVREAILPNVPVVLPDDSLR